MKLKQISAIAVSGVLCAQLALSKTAPLDSLSDTLAQNNIANYISDQLDLIADSVHFVHLEEEFDTPPILKFVPTTVEGRLAYLQKTVPLTYNTQVQSYIDVYSTDRYKGYLSRMMGLGQYYFPIYEQVFAEAGVPDEIKYLSIVESALNPHAVSRVGATGLWQFMYATARVYNLAMDTYIDERKDPIAASYAAAAYLSDAYNEFGDWLLAIASYNCGKGNVLRAIQRSGLTNPDYWAISAYLPRETRNYVPAFIAMTYMLGYHKEHGIEPVEVDDIRSTTETVWVQKFIPFGGVAQALDIDEDIIKSLNPAYKRGIVNGSPEFPKRLILPEVQPEAYSALYAALNNPSGTPTLMNAANSTNVGQETLTHRVRKGETLDGIAKRYGVTVQDLRVWNSIKKNIIVPGQRLDVHRQASLTSEKGDLREYLSYKVRKGDTLSDIAQRHRGASVSAIKAANGLKNNKIKPGMTLKIKVD
ncbi:LysM peptidoglycan-binding domain-containing protein [Parapedobacter koreensis]|uniref:Membrane-bound lytic murein transglycosylase D n=1 Tax=Parapedobacter koreensis TaxID=332977 RepID=A0A1H7REW5_9SPHI|nr:LysM peptidoglycan-binding domain-containing protein [Parapedobacter koreensis]SEL58786.1 membrane-bound lytic murein transglycosylase D [Parapedobacter koreensis]